MATGITLTHEEMVGLLDAVLHRARASARGDCGCDEMPQGALHTGWHLQVSGRRSVADAGPLPDSWVPGTRPDGLGSTADAVDWYAAFLAGAAIGPVLSQAQVADVVSDDLAEAMRGEMRKRIEIHVDEWCGTWRPWPGPKWEDWYPRPPRPPRPNEVPLVQMRLGVHFQAAAKATADTALRGVFENGAGRLFQAGVDRMKTLARVRLGGVRICDDFARMIADTRGDIRRKHTLLESESERLRELEGQEPRDDAKIEEMRANIDQLRSELESDESQLQLLEEEYSAACS